MKTITINGQLTAEEREVALVYNYADKKWIMDTTMLKYYNKARKQGWTQTTEYVYKDGSVCGGVFEAPIYAVTIRSTTKKQMTEKQMCNLLSDDDNDE